MLRITQNSNAAGAKSYYSTADYYSEGQELTGVWRGLGAQRLGLSGTVEREDWDALCDNRDPETGGVLTARQKSNRRIGYDFNFHVPKSVSLIYALTEDERILEAFREAVGETMQAIEAEAKTRVRSKGRNEDRVTGNLVWGEFVHFTARPVAGVPDPHLHAHCFVFNTTYDETEQRWKAGQFADLKRDAPYFEALFHANLADRVARLGYGVERTRSGWEIEGLPRATLQKFSRRTALIEAKARAAGITDPDQKDGLGAKTREGKDSELTLPELRAEWRARLSTAEREVIDKVSSQSAAGREGPGRPARAQAARAAVDLALDHCFERSAVVPERTALTEALRRSYGLANVQAVQSEFTARPLLRAERTDRAFVTTPAVLEEERAMLRFAREGRGTCAPLGAGDHAMRRAWLNTDQQSAVRHLVTSPDRVMVIRGAAGVGKTTMMQEAVEAIEAGGHRVFTFAPSADASREVLRQEGFAEADTVARLLVDTELQNRTRDQVIWIDEAGLLGSRTMGRVFELAGRMNARVVLSGDRRQHGSVERGAPLRLLETEAGVVPAEIREIQRQRGEYKRAVHALSEGRVEDAMRQLDSVGWIREVPDAQRYRALAADYLDATARGESALVVSPTHAEGELITAEIRTALRKSARLHGAERTIEALQPLHWTEAERGDAASYEPGDVLVFHQNAPGFRKGQRVAVEDLDAVPVDQAARFQVYRSREIQFAAGDRVRITRNGRTADGHALSNGAVFTVKSVGRRGDVVLANGWKIDRSFGHLAHGYVVTSHASQGKSVDRVFIGQSAASGPASSREQFYVSVSRGKKSATIYTSDKAELLEAVSESEDRPTATEFLSDADRRARAATLARRRELAARDTAPGRERQPERELIHD